jgi:ubiquilin
MSDVNITIKCSNADKVEISAHSSITVNELKIIISEKLSLDPTLQRLIFRGRVLKDENSLEFYEIFDGCTVHLVKGVANSQLPSSQATTNPFPAPLSSVTASSNLDSSNFLGGRDAMSNLAPIQEQMLRNPEMLQSMMNSPLMDSFFNNPELMRDMIMSNPQLRTMMDQNPQIRHILNNPTVSLFDLLNIYR